MLTQEDRNYLGYVKATVIPGLRKVAETNRFQKAYEPEVQEAIALAERLEKQVEDIESREMRSDLLQWLYSDRVQGR